MAKYRIVDHGSAAAYAVAVLAEIASGVMPAAVRETAAEYAQRHLDALVKDGTLEVTAVITEPGGGVTPEATPLAAGATSSLPRGFELVRLVDVSGVSGTGVVAEGLEFTDGSVALRWRGEHPSTVAWDNIASVLAVHGHEGATVLNWLDGES